MNHLKTIIIDDSKVIRDELKLLLTEFPQVVFAGEASRLASGIYYHTIQSKGFSRTNKMILIK